MKRKFNYKVGDILNLLSEYGEFINFIRIEGNAIIQERIGQYYYIMEYTIRSNSVPVNYVDLRNIHHEYSPLMFPWDDGYI